MVMVGPEFGGGMVRGIGVVGGLGRGNGEVSEVGVYSVIRLRRIGE